MKNKLITVLILVMLFIIIMTSISIALTGKVNDSNIRVRSGPSTEGTETLTNLYLNDPVEVLEKIGEWYKIEMEDDKIGYIFADYVTVSGDIPNSNIKTEETENVEQSEEKEVPEEKDEEVEEPETEEEKEINVTIKVNLSGKNMPLMFSSEKYLYKSGTVLKVLDEKAFWSKVTDEKNDAWVLTKNLLFE